MIRGLVVLCARLHAQAHSHSRAKRASLTLHFGHCALILHLSEAQPFGAAKQ
jgi:hypothetical protein